MVDCIFCKIIAGEIPGKFVYKDDLVTAFHDINPVAAHPYSGHPQQTYRINK